MGRLNFLYATDGRLYLYEQLNRIYDSSGQHRVILADEGQAAITHFCVERLAGLSHVEIEIETGRMHQIRAHAPSLSHAVVGDQRYAEQAATTDLNRLFFHSHYLRLRWPDERIFGSPSLTEPTSALDALRAPVQAH